jgi:hypothetical protein
MKTHPYLRAYMAGIAVPTLFLLIVLCGFIVARFVFQIPLPLERVIVFPMALVPNIFGLWNMLYLALRSHRHLPLGFHGALLPFVLAPLGGLLAWSLGFLSAQSRGLVYFQQVTIPYAHFAIGFVCGLILYYLVWKYLVGFLNQVVGIA